MLSELLPEFVVTQDSQSYDPPICCQNGADTTLGYIISWLWVVLERTAQ